ncbi:VOC family protein [Cesiribacter sp. SM1]|uniref:VOC family protein n=1 Tax=Cesiribacter sp. SM1 TaxID=2861196 RepID=UPI001CD8080A|nr:hypothetical protein [Cesiribacter sp. SM1]
MIIKELTLNTSNIKATMHFYGSCLQLPLIDQSVDKVSFAIGASILSFTRTDEKPFYHFAFNIPCNLLTEALEWVEARTTILSFSENSRLGDFTGWRAKAFYFHDHEGNIAECIARFDLPGKAAATGFDQNSFLNISEIGLVVDDVAAEAESFSSQYQLPYFSKGPKLADFMPMGDDEGLFLLTKSGRGWLPTGRAAEKHEVQLRFRQHNKDFELNLKKEGVLPR